MKPVDFKGDYQLIEREDCVAELNLEHGTGYDYFVRVWDHEFPYELYGFYSPLVAWCDGHFVYRYPV